MKCSKNHDVTNTSIDPFVNKNNGCIICSGNVPWSEKYNDFKKECEGRKYKLLTTEEEWKKYANSDFKPKMICDKGHTVKNTSISSFVSQNSGCMICFGNVPWSERYSEYKEECEKINFKLLTTEEEWKKYANIDFKPKMICDKGHQVTNTSIDKFIGSNRGCPECVNKTEGKFNKYLNENKEKLKIKSFEIHYKPEWANLKQSHNTSYEFDFIIELTNDVKIIIEIDGRQHFTQVSNWESPLHVQIRDKIKERLALRNRYSVLRLNQEYIYNDKNNWQDKLENYIFNKIEFGAKLDVTDYTDSKRYI
jgi:very-short-patch-repair endonuclease